MATKRIRARQAGQGIIEYGGALVIATLFVATAISTLNPNYLADIMQALQSQLEGLLIPS